MNDLKVKEIMTRFVVTLALTETIHEALTKLATNRISGAPVVQEGEVIGMISESDILRTVAPTTSPPAARRAAQLVRDVVSDLLVYEISPDASVWEAASIMNRKGVKRLPVVDSANKLIGIVARADIIRAMGRPDEAIKDDVLATLQILGPENFEDLDVAVDQGVAIIRGHADRKSTKQIAARLAGRVPGITGVNDEMTYEVDDSRIKAVAG